MQDVNVLNGYQIVDLATYRSDGFVIKNLWATAFLNGVNIGGGTQTGWLQQVVFSYGDLYESRHRQLTSHVRRGPDRELHRDNLVVTVLRRQHQRLAVARRDVVPSRAASRDLPLRKHSGPDQLGVVRVEQ